MVIEQRLGLDLDGERVWNTTAWYALVMPSVVGLNVCVQLSKFTIRLIRDGEEGRGRGYRGGGRGRLCTYSYTVTTRMTPALRWAEMRAILIFH